MINLVPPEIRKLKGVRSVAYALAFFYVIIIALIALGLAGLATYNYTQKVSISNLQSKLDNMAAEQKKNQSILTQAAFIESRVNSVSKYQAGYDWVAVLNAIAGATPTDVTLSTVKLSGESSKPPTLAITGQSGNRRSIILFADKLSVTKPFTGASITSLTESESDGIKSYSFGVSVGMAKGGQ